MGLFAPILFAILAMVSPWAIGGNWPFARTCFIGFSILGLVLALLELITRRKRFRFQLIWVLLLAGAGLTYLQTVPLNDSVREGIQSVAGAESKFVSESLQSPSVYPAATREKLVDLVLGIGLFFASLFLLSERKRIVIMMGALTLVGVALSFFGIAQNMSWNGKLFWQYELLQGGWPFASFVNKNNAAGFLLVTFSTSLFFIAQQVFAFSRNRQNSNLILNSDDWESEHMDGKRTIRSKLLEAVAGLQPRHLYFGAAIAIIFAGIFGSLSRGGMVALAGASSVGFLLIARANRWMVVLLTIVMVAGGIGLVIYSEQSTAISSQIESFTDLEKAASSRFVHWNDAWPFAVENWVAGTGNGTYRYVSPNFETDAFQRTFAHAENIYLETLVEMGIVGCLLLMLILICCLVSSVRLCRRSSSNDQALGLVGLVCLTGQLIAAFFDFGLYQPANLVVMSIVMGMVVGRAARPESVRVKSENTGITPLISENGDGSSRRIENKSTLNLIPGVIVLVAIAGTCWAGYESLGIESRKHAGRTVAKLKRQNGEARGIDKILDQAQLDLERAIKIRPDDSESHFQLGELMILKYRIKAAEQSADLLKKEKAAILLEQPTIEFEIPSEEMIWNSTSISILHREYRLAERKQKELAVQLKESKLADQYLSNAYQAFLKAESCCPRLGKTQLRLAQLSAFFDPGNEASHLDTALSRAPNNTQLLFDCGLLALNSGEHTVAIELWGRCLANPYSHTYERPIVELSQMELPLKAMFERVLPLRPEFLLMTARKYFHEPRLMLPKKFLLAHTKKVIEKTDLSEIERLFYLAEADRMSGQFQSAIIYYRQAIELEPSNVVWRFQYANCLYQVGEYDEAIRQLKICELEPSKIHSNIKPLLNRIRLERVPKRT